MPKSVFTRRIASSRRALKKQFAGNRKDSSDPAAQTTTEEEADPIILKAAEIYGNSERKGKKERWGLAFSGVEGLPRVCAPCRCILSG